MALGLVPGVMSKRLQLNLIPVMPNPRPSPHTPRLPRPPNVMLREGESGVWSVQLVDLDWAGPEGQARYPPAMAPHDVIPWHPEAGPLAVMRQDHDTFALEHLF